MKSKITGIRLSVHDGIRFVSIRRTFSDGQTAWRATSCKQFSAATWLRLQRAQTALAPHGVER